MNGYFNEHMLQRYAELMAEQIPVEFSEDGETYDFTRCVRPDGSAYAIASGKKCRQGTEQAADVVAPKAKKAKKEKAPTAPKAPTAKKQGEKAASAVAPAPKPDKAAAAPAPKGPQTKEKKFEELAGKLKDDVLAKVAKNPKAPAGLQEAAKKEIAARSNKPETKAPKEEKGYKPKENPEQRKGLRGLKDRLTGGKKKDLDSLVKTEKEIKNTKDEYVGNLFQLKIAAKTPQLVEQYQRSIDRAERNANLEISRIGTNKKFAQDLKANLPANVKAAVDKETGEIILKQKVGRNTIETTFNQANGFNYRVNGKYDAGTVKDRKEQLRVAMAVRNQYDALVRSLPEGTVIKTSPYSADGGGAARQKAYEKLGFGKPNEIEEMFAIKKDGKMVPSTVEQQRAAFENPDTLWFAEEVNKKEEVKAWLQIVTGVEQ